MTLIVFIVMILTVIFGTNSKAAAMMSALVTVCNIPFHDKGYFKVVLVLQICSDSQHILPGPSSDTNAVSSDCAYHVGNKKVEGDLDMQVEEELKVKTEKGVCSKVVEECVDIKDEESMYL